LDEATSALDAKTEELVLSNIRKRGCTCIIVAHRLSAIRDCKQIIVMKHGKVVESGDHSSLIKADGYYKELVSNM
jgi:ABC-type multidrug transport system fused ATPase/permease subunit